VVGGLLLSFKDCSFGLQLRNLYLEKVSSRKINLEDNTHVQESKASQLPV
jgi:hypothetical protein